MDAACKSGARGAVVIALTGEIDMNTAADIDERVQAALDAGALDLTLDVAGVTFMDSQGLYAMFKAQAAIIARGGRFALASPSRAVQLVVRVAGLEPRLPIQL